jgi:hypothetical protein
VIITGYVPAGVAEVVDMLNVELPVAGLKLGVAPVGNPLALQLTVPLNPFSGVTVVV